jgi:poly(3-hydroxybutyrate) depolymerase
MRRSLLAVSLLLSLMRPVPISAAEPARATGFVEHAYLSPIDDSTQKFMLFVPSDYDASRRWPLIVFLHGAGEWENARRPTEVGLPLRQRMESFPFLVAYPLGRGTMGFGTLAEQDVLSVLAEAKRLYAVDEDRVYLTGLSMGGMGTFRLGLLHPHLWAALAPVCGRGEPRLAENGLHLPLWAFHGDADTSVPVSGSRDMVARYRELMYNVRYSEYAGVGHNSWDRAYAGNDLYDWLLTHRRVTRPERVRFRTDGLRHARAYWLTILALHDYSQSGSVDAIFDRTAGTLTVRGENVTTVYIDRASTPWERFRVVTEGSIQRVIEGKGPAQGSRLPESLRKGMVKRPGLSGPIEDVFYDRVLFVVGTRGTQAQTAANEAAAKRAADWGRTAHVSFRILRDSEVPRAEITRSHLVLFGGAATNRLAAELKTDALPVRLTDTGAQVGGRTISAASPGLLAIYPNPRTLSSDSPRYLLLCDAADAGGLLAMAAHLGRPREHARHDWVLLDTGTPGSPTLLSRGSFDGRWQVTPAAPEPARVPGPPGRRRWPKPVVALRPTTDMR